LPHAYTLKTWFVPRCSLVIRQILKETARYLDIRLGEVVLKKQYLMGKLQSLSEALRCWFELLSDQRKQLVENAKHGIRENTAD